MQQHSSSAPTLIWSSRWECFNNNNNKKIKTFQSHISTETSVCFHSLTHFEQHVASERRQWVGLKETQRNLRNTLFYTATLSIDQRKKAE